MSEPKVLTNCIFLQRIKDELLRRYKLRRYPSLDNIALLDFYSKMGKIKERLRSLPNNVNVIFTYYAIIIIMKILVNIVIIALNYKQTIESYAEYKMRYWSQYVLNHILFVVRQNRDNAGLTGTLHSSIIRVITILNTHSWMSTVK